MNNEKSLVMFTDETPPLPEEKADAKREAKQQGLGLNFWLRLPMRVRPLRFVPGRNRREKRTFRKLADQQERGTLTKGNAKKLDMMFAQLLRLAGFAAEQGK